MKRTLRVVLSSTELIQIVSAHLIFQHGIELVPGSMPRAEFMAIAVKNEAGQVEFPQYRVEIELDEVKEDWRG